MSLRLSDSSRALTWVAVLGAAVAGDGLVVGSARLVIAGTALALPALVLVRRARRAAWKRHMRAVPVASTRVMAACAPVRGVVDGAVYRWENEGGAACTT